MQLPATQHNAYVVRTDFSQDESWEAIRTRGTTGTVEGFVASCEFVSDSGNKGATAEEVLALLPSRMRFVFIADERSMQSSDHPLLACSREPSEQSRFRVAVDHLWGPENNLTLYNMDWADYVDAVQPDGVYRGFRQV